MSVRENNLWSLNQLLGLISRAAILSLILTSSLSAQTTGSNLSSTSNNAEELLKSANLAFETGDFDRAISEFSILSDRFPKDSSISNNYAVALFQAGQHADAAAVIQEFLSEHSEVGEITNNLFTVYDYMASESYALLNGVEPEVPDLKLSDSVPNISDNQSSSNQRPTIDKTVNDADVNTAINVNNDTIVVTRMEQVNLADQPNAPSSATKDVINSLSSNETGEIENTDNKVSLSSAIEGSSVPVSPNEAEIIEARLNNYIQSWTDGDVDWYLSFYYPSISPVAGVSYNDWYQSRIERIFPERQIELSVDQVRVHFESGEDVILEYLQRYRSRNYSDRTLKQMRWRKYQGVWYIRNEKSLPR